MAGLRYEVSIEGAASPTVRAAFGDCEVDTLAGCTTVCCDRASLPGVIARIEGLALRLLGIRLVAEHPAPNGRLRKVADNPWNVV